MKKAVIVGGGVAGLACARVLAKYFDQVVVYDCSPQGPQEHLHTLMRSGQEYLEEIFPGIKSQIMKARAPVIDWAQDTLWLNQYGGFPQYDSSVRTFSFGRTLLLKLMRESLSELSNVKIVAKKVESLPEADFVVIAAGSKVRLDSILKFSSYKEESQIINLTYRSYLFNKSDVHLQGQLYYQLEPPQVNIGCVIAPVEESKMIATLIECEEEFSVCKSYEDFLTKSPNHLRLALDCARPISDISVYRKTKTYRRKINVADMPSNTIVVGDALMSLNPVFGHGMTVALKQVLLLDKMLKSDFNASQFQKECQQISSFAYYLSFIGSSQVRPLKKILQIYLMVCQRSKIFHHAFLKRLHAP